MSHPIFLYYILVRSSLLNFTIRTQAIYEKPVSIPQIIWNLSVSKNKGKSLSTVHRIGFFCLTHVFMSSLMRNKNKYLNNAQWAHHGQTTSKQHCFNAQGTAINLFCLYNGQCLMIRYQASVITKQ